MEPRLLFYGYYFEKSLAIDVIEGHEVTYNMPLAYILTNIVIMGVSLLLMVRQWVQCWNESRDAHFISLFLISEYIKNVKLFSLSLCAHL